MRIQLLMRPTGAGNNEPYEIGHLATPPVLGREEAAGIARKHASAFTHHGYNAEQDYWWGRNDGDPETAIFVLQD